MNALLLTHLTHYQMRMMCIPTYKEFINYLGQLFHSVRVQHHCLTVVTDYSTPRTDWSLYVYHAGLWFIFNKGLGIILHFGLRFPSPLLVAPSAYRWYVAHHLQQPMETRAVGSLGSSVSAATARRKVQAESFTEVWTSLGRTLIFYIFVVTKEDERGIGFKEGIHLTIRATFSWDWNFHSIGFPRAFL